MKYRFFILIMYLLPFTTLSQGITEFILIDSCKKYIPNPRQKEIDKYNDSIEKETLKGNFPKVPLELPIFYVLLPNNKDTLSVNEYFSHFDKTKHKEIKSFRVQVNWDSRICFISTEEIDNEIDKVFWESFWKYIFAKNGFINNIPATLETTFYIE